MVNVENLEKNISSCIAATQIYILSCVRQPKMSRIQQSDGITKFTQI